MALLREILLAYPGLAEGTDEGGLDWDPSSKIDVRGKLTPISVGAETVYVLPSFSAENGSSSADLVGWHNLEEIWTEDLELAAQSFAGFTLCKKSAPGPCAALFLGAAWDESKTTLLEAT